MAEASEKVKQVAAVLALHEYRPKHWLTEAENDRERLLDLASRAIEVMREPTDAMKRADGVHWDYSCHVCGGLAEGWNKMFDCALGKS